MKSSYPHHDLLQICFMYIYFHLPSRSDTTENAAWGGSARS